MRENAMTDTSAARQKILASVNRQFLLREIKMSVGGEIAVTVPFELDGTTLAEPPTVHVTRTVKGVAVELVVKVQTEKNHG